MNNELDELINAYRITKSDADSLKKVAYKQNSQIKEMMLDNELSEFKTENGYVAKCTVTERDTVDEDLLVLKLQSVKDKYPGLIKKKDYVDMDELENLIYQNSLDDETMKLVEDCITTKEVVQLRISKAKKGE